MRERMRERDRERGREREERNGLECGFKDWKERMQNGEKGDTHAHIYIGV